MPAAPSASSSTTSATSSTRRRSPSSPTTCCSTTARAGRSISFEQDHLTDYRPPRLELSLVHDSLGQPFLLLAGYEPDFAWDAFAATVLEFVDVLEVVDRDLGARDPDAGAAHAPDRHDGERHARRAHRGALGVAAAHAGALDRRPPARVPPRRGGRRGRRASSCSFPTTWATPSTRRPRSPALDSLTVATGPGVLRRRPARGEPRVPHEGRRAGRRAATSSPAWSQGLEERYDAYMAGSTLATPMIHTGDLPSADELAAELERFLASRPDGRRRQALSRAGGMPRRAPGVVVRACRQRTTGVRLQV